MNESKNKNKLVYSRLNAWAIVFGFLFLAVPAFIMAILYLIYIFILNTL